MSETIDQRLAAAEQHITLMAGVLMQQGQLNNQLHLLHLKSVVQASESSTMAIKLLAQKTGDEEFIQKLNDIYAKADSENDQLLAFIENTMRTLPKIPPATSAG